MRPHIGGTSEFVYRELATVDSYELVVCELNLD